VRSSAPMRTRPSARPVTTAIPCWSISGGSSARRSSGLRPSAERSC
jgi:hypothetical protein